MGVVLLDRRYSVSTLLSATAHTRRFAGCHIGLDALVRIIELRAPDPARGARPWDAARCAAFVARAAALRHPVLPRVRDCFCVHDACYIVEDALDDEPLITRLSRGAAPALHAVLRDGLLLCDAVAHLAHDAPELLRCLLISGSTLAYDAGGALHLTTWDYSRWHDARGALEPGAPDLRAPELVSGAVSAPDERSQVYSVADLLSWLLAGQVDPAADTPAAGRRPETVQAALAPALHADPGLRTPDAETLGRALARAARVALPALNTPSAGNAYRPDLVSSCR